MSTLPDETPSDQDLLGDVNISGFGLPDESMIDTDGWPDAPPSEAEIDALFVAETERREREQAEQEYSEVQAQESNLIDLLQRSIEIENAKRQQRISL